MTWERLTETPVLLAVIGILVTVVVAPLVKKLFFDPRLRLLVDVRIFAHPTHVALANATREALKMDFMHPMWGVLRATGCVVITIKNISKKKISGVTVRLPDLASDITCQVDDAEEFVTSKSVKAVPIGDIQPGHVRSLYVWTVDMSDFDFGKIKKFFHVSADELDGVRFRFPTPGYIKGKYAQVFLTMMVLFALMMVAGMIGGFIR
jgi:hypothetical protein